MVTGLGAVFFSATPRTAAGDDFAPGLPTGPPYPSTIERPRDEAQRPPACSFRLPVCVHAGHDVPPEMVLGTLTDLERAARRLTGGIGLPWPLADGALGGGPGFDVYLVAPSDPSLAGGLEKTSRDAPSTGAFDRASAFAVLRADLQGCLRQNVLARVLASAVGWRLDAGEDPVVRESIAAYLAELAEPCGVVTTDLVDDFQAHPERALTAQGDAGPASAMPWPWYIDSALGSGSPGVLPVALAALGSQHTPPGSLEWRNEPDFFDTLRGALKAKTPPLAVSDVLGDFAVARLFMGARDDGLHFAGSAFAGSFGRIRFDWSIDYASLPRRLSPERPIDPTGATYVWIDVRSAPPGARLAMRMEWEPPVVFRWVLVRVRLDGSEASRVLVTPQQRSTSAEKNLDDLSGLAGVAIVGVNTGDLRLDDLFDPDIAPYEPHSYVLTLAAGTP